MLKSLQAVLILNVLVMLVQAAFAGRILGGGSHALLLHGATAKALVLLACVQVLLTVTLRLQKQCPLWVPLASAGLLGAEVLEFAAGELHNVALHVPLGVAIFGGALRLLFWSAGNRAVTPTGPRRDQSFCNPWPEAKESISPEAKDQ